MNETLVSASIAGLVATIQNWRWSKKTSKSASYPISPLPPLGGHPHDHDAGGQVCRQLYTDRKNTSSNLPFDHRYHFHLLTSIVYNHGSHPHTHPHGDDGGQVCRQLYTEHKLLSLTADGQLEVDSFKVGFDQPFKHLRPNFPSFK